MMKTLFKFVLFHIAIFLVVVLLADDTKSSSNEVAENKKERLERP